MAAFFDVENETLPSVEFASDRQIDSSFLYDGSKVSRWTNSPFIIFFFNAAGSAAPRGEEKDWKGFNLETCSALPSPVPWRADSICDSTLDDASTDASESSDSSESSGSSGCFLLLASFCSARTALISSLNWSRSRLRALLELDLSEEELLESRFSLSLPLDSPVFPAASDA